MSREGKPKAMKKHYDFSNGRRGPAIAPVAGKTRVTIYLDDAVLEHFKRRSSREGRGYQTLINGALRAGIGADDAALTPRLLRRIVREELGARVKNFGGGN